MVAAFAALKQSDLYMVWIGDGELRAKTERLIEERGLGDRFLPRRQPDDVSRLLPAFDVFAMSSLCEGLSCSVVEAMTCGVPVVATAVNSVPEIVLAGQTGLLARAGDPASLTPSSRVHARSSGRRRPHGGGRPRSRRRALQVGGVRA